MDQKDNLNAYPATYTNGTNPNGLVTNRGLEPQTQGLRARIDEKLTDVRHQLADVRDQAGTWTRDRSQRAVAATRELARNRPLAFTAGLFVAGVVVARLFKSYWASRRPTNRQLSLPEPNLGIRDDVLVVALSEKDYLALKEGRKHV